MVVTGCSVAEAQEISTEVIPSEEQLLDALSSGEIDYDTYLLLLDLMLNGADSTQINWFDLLPSTVGSREGQENDFVRASSFGRTKRSFVKYQFGGELQDSGRTKYRMSGRYNVDSCWSGEIGLAREYSGRERFMRRSVTYASPSAAITIGNYRTQFGLGTVIGYRGKLVDYSDKLDGESIIFPDYGGFNGVLAESKWENLSISVLGSYQRDSAHGITTLAARGLSISPESQSGLIFAAHVIQNRVIREKVELYLLGGYFRQKWRKSAVEVEFSDQVGEVEGRAAVVVAKQIWTPVRLDVQAWYYSRDYFGFSTGSPAASLTSNEEIESIGVQFSDKRSGQTGGRMQTVVRPRENWSVSSDLLYARRGDDTSTLQGLIGVSHRVNTSHRLTADFLYKFLEKAGVGESIKRRGRVEWRGDWAAVRARSSIGFTNETTHGEYWSLLVQCFLGKEGSERWQVWSNWRRIAHSRIDAWHGFVSVTEELAKSIRGSVKFTDSYSRTATPRHSPTIGLELQVQL